MHETALDNGRRFFQTYPVTGVDFPLVVDIGGMDVNGTLREVAPVHYRYVGIDVSAGPGVDVIAPDPYALPLETATVDLVVSTSVFEHAEFFWLSFLEMLRIVKPTGFIYLNAPSNGMVHRHPVDCWRFYPDSGVALQNWAWRNGYSTRLCESFTRREGPTGWRDFVAVYAAPRSILPEARIVDGIAGEVSDGYRFDWKETEPSP